MGEKVDVNWNELFGNPLKKYSTEKIEETIAQCLSALSQQELETIIKCIDYYPNKKGSNMGDTIEMHLEIRKPIKSTLQK